MTEEELLEEINKDRNNEQQINVLGEKSTLRQIIFRVSWSKKTDNNVFFFYSF